MVRDSIIGEIHKIKSPSFLQLLHGNGCIRDIESVDDYRWFRPLGKTIID